MSKKNWSLDSSNGELRVLTGVGGPAAKMGHRLTIGVNTWQGTVTWEGAKPVGVELTAEVDSFEVLKGEGGVTPLTSPERGIARNNALKSMDAKKHPRIRFAAEEISETADGYRLTGTLEIHGKSRAQTVDVRAEDRGENWALSAEVPVTQSDFGVKPFSLMMGTVKVADVVTVEFAATHPK